MTEESELKDILKKEIADKLRSTFENNDELKKQLGNPTNITDKHIHKFVIRTKICIC